MVVSCQALCSSVLTAAPEDGYCCHCHFTADKTRGGQVSALLAEEVAVPGFGHGHSECWVLSIATLVLKR